MSAIDNETFSELIREYTPALYRLAYGILSNREEAEDVVSESVLKAYEKLHTLRKAECFRAWIMQIGVNEARRAYGRRKRYAPVEDVEEYMPAFEDEYHELWDVVMKLDMGYRETVILYFYEQLSIREIARILHVAEGTVKSRLSRAKKQLKTYLQ